MCTSRLIIISIGEYFQRFQQHVFFCILTGKKRVGKTNSQRLRVGFFLAENTIIFNLRISWPSYTNVDWALLFFGYEGRFFSSFLTFLLPRPLPDGARAQGKKLLLNP